MKKYRIDVEATAKITLWVEAASEKEARELAYACNYRLEDVWGDESITGYHDGTQSGSPWVELETPCQCEFLLEYVDHADVKSVREEQT